METLVQVRAISRGLNKQFPDGRDPFKILARLLEESGEVAQAVHHLEKQGRKVEKHGNPESLEPLAKELQDVLRAVMQISEYYACDEVLDRSIQRSYDAMVNEGVIIKHS